MEKASIRFLKRDSLYEREKPFQIFMNLTPDARDPRKHNLLWEEKTVSVADFRAQASDFHLDTHGFTTRKLEGFTELPEGKVVTDSYIPALKNMLQQELQEVGTIFVFDWRV